MMSQGRSKRGILGWMLAAGLLAGAGAAQASSLTVREIQLQGGLSAKILLDGTLPRGSVNIDYVRDNVQFSIVNSTIYPAKILHAEGDSPKTFHKVFAYQYAPNLVRIRFSVDGNADALKGKIKLVNLGRALEVIFPQPTEEMVREDSPEKEASLLSKVLGQESKSDPKAEVQPENRLDAKAETKSEPETLRSKPEPELKGKGQPLGRKVELGRPAGGPSPMRSLLAMFLVVGGLGLVLVFVKRLKGAPRGAGKGKDSWLKGLLSAGSKDRSYIEVLANHALGPKQSITVVRIRDQQFVLGVTQDSVQLITQIDSEDGEIDVLEDPKVADSLGKMFGAKVRPANPRSPAVQANPSFEKLLKNSSGAGAVVARNAYQSQSEGASGIEAAVGFRESARPASVPSQTSGARDQIRRRLQGMRQV